MTRLLAAALCLSLARGAAAGTPAPKPLRVSTIDAGFPSILLDYAERKGFFAAEGVAVEAQPAARFILPAVLSGRAEAALISLAPVLEAYQNGADVRLLGALYPRFDHYAVSRYKPGDARKIKVAAYNAMGAASRLVMEPFLDYLKLDGDKLGAVAAAGEGARYALLERGEADLITLSSPALRRKIAAEGRFFVIPAGAGGGGDPVALACSGRALRERGPELERFSRALRAAVRAAAADPAGTSEFLVSARGFERPDAAELAAALSAAARGWRSLPSLELVDSVLARMKSRAPRGPRDYRGLLP